MDQQPSAVATGPSWQGYMVNTRRDKAPTRLVNSGNSIVTVLYLLHKFFITCFEYAACQHANIRISGAYLHCFMNLNGQGSMSIISVA